MIFFIAKGCGVHTVWKVSKTVDLIGIDNVHSSWVLNCRFMFPVMPLLSNPGLITTSCLHVWIDLGWLQ